MAKELVLIVEDNEKNRKLIRDLLQAKGYLTIESETAEEGLRLAEEMGFDVALEDRTGSRSDGYPTLWDGWHYRSCLT